MNDTKDTTYLLEEVSKIFTAQKKSKESPDTIKDQILKKALFYNGEPYIICFSELYDNYHMWKEYGDKGQGAAIEFCIDRNILPCQVIEDKFRKCTTPKEYTCYYWNPNEIKTKYYDRFENHFFSIPSSTSNEIEIAQNSLIIKHPCFKNEAEHRIIVVALDYTPVSFEFIDNHIYKYIPVKFYLSCVKRIIIGPNTPQRDYDFIGEYFKGIGQLSNIEITRSEIPFKIL